MPRRLPEGRDREREFALNRGTHLISDGRRAVDTHGVFGTAGKLPGHHPRANASRMSPAKPAERYVAPRRPTYTTLHLHLLIVVVTPFPTFPSLWPRQFSSHLWKSRLPHVRFPRENLLMYRYDIHDPFLF